MAAMVTARIPPARKHLLLRSMRNALLVTSVHPKETNFTSETRGRGRTAENFKILSARSPRLSASAAKALALFLPKVFCSRCSGKCTKRRINRRA